MIRNLSLNLLNKILKLQPVRQMVARILHLRNNPNYFPTKMNVVIYILQYITSIATNSIQQFVQSGFVILSNELIIIGLFYFFHMAIEKIKIVRAVLKLSAKQHCQFGPILR